MDLVSLLTIILRSDYKAGWGGGGRLSLKANLKHRNLFHDNAHTRTRKVDVLFLEENE
jgi:hypothetical protein